MIKLISEMNVDNIIERRRFFVDTNVLLVVHFGFRIWAEEKIACYFIRLKIMNLGSIKKSIMKTGTFLGRVHTIAITSINH